ncbi:MAG: ATP-dependent zinc metalloprotease FtsH, partial [Acidimicrobiia bacterium]
PNADPLHKVSIISRGMALGYTLALPMEDKFLASKSELIDELAMLLGGRVAEELVFQDPTTGAQNDLERATKIARKMVCEYGMSERLGPMTLGEKVDQPFLGRDIAAHPDYSDHVAAEIDVEIRRLVDEAHDEAWEILTTHRKQLDAIVDALIEKETLEKEEVGQILADVPKRAPRGEAISRPRRQPADRAAASALTAEEAARKSKAPSTRAKPRRRPGAEPAPA